MTIKEYWELVQDVDDYLTEVNVALPKLKSAEACFLALTLHNYDADCAMIASGEAPSCWKKSKEEGAIALRTLADFFDTIVNNCRYGQYIREQIRYIEGKYYGVE